MNTVVLSPRIGEAAHGLELAGCPPPVCFVYDKDEYDLDFPSFWRYGAVPSVVRESPYADKVLAEADVVIGLEHPMRKNAMSTPLKGKNVRLAPNMPLYSNVDRAFVEASQLESALYITTFDGEGTIVKHAILPEFFDYVVRLAKKVEMQVQIVSIPHAWYGIPSNSRFNFFLISKTAYAFDLFGDLLQKLEPPKILDILPLSNRNSKGEKEFNESPYAQFMQEYLGKNWRNEFVGSFQNFIIRRDEFSTWANWIAARRGESEIHYSFYEDARDRIFGAPPVDRSPKILTSFNKRHQFAYTQIVHPRAARYLTITETSKMFGLSREAGQMLEDHEFSSAFQAAFRFWNTVPAAAYADILYLINGRKPMMRKHEDNRVRAYLYPAY